MNLRRIAENLKRIRGTRSKAEMASLLGVTVSAVGNYENGLRIPRDETKLKYADIAGKTVDEIFYI